MKDHSKLEIDVNDIQEHYNGKNVNIADVESYVNHVVIGQPKKTNTKNQPSIVTSQGFYVSQVDYIEYLIAKRDTRKRKLRRRRTGVALYLAIIWMVKCVFSAIVICVVVYGFYMLCWVLQQSF